jgi:hypothetical protein
MFALSDEALENLRCRIVHPNKSAFCCVCVYDVWMLQRYFGWYLQVTFEAHREDSTVA